MTNNSTHLSIKVDSAESHTKNGSNLRTDPWSHVGGKRFDGHNPWLGKYDRRKSQRSGEDFIEYTES